mmetsp:Transcript_34791/g.68462  ORF Transcript_34791/g.68462 Transcript_34791/m.68462 type:complete len:629 (-) Transcript_34791:14-1900(-)|eukprot:CAMPEP_0194331436 /NCGR_PEP_ID=MMETSP0171-20130528/55550_1 /TAXON_ID=218684 /ORGANISM="Corethron pennatum, Strain L29A3" /LENGTH=628 /DNA_ID=CAMNT_0039092895 /DNA_START=34 /DNA_END=1920 /DNA_ORIENTATION=+
MKRTAIPSCRAFLNFVKPVEISRKTHSLRLSIPPHFYRSHQLKILKRIEQKKYSTSVLLNSSASFLNEKLNNSTEINSDQHPADSLVSASSKYAVQEDPSLLTTVKFQDADLHQSTKKALANIFKLGSMTEIQAETYATASSGTDVLGRARTGTGKTLAFLIPALERLLKNDFQSTIAGNKVGILVVSPTRELAMQIGDQAEKLLTYHKGLSCQVIFGGTKMGRDINLLNNRLPTILVATPGRLLAHMEDTILKNGKNFGYDIMRETPILVLDETDRLLDMGFRNEISKIMSFLPRKEKRQTLLFSATVPQELKKIMAENMRKDFVEVDCIGKDGAQDGAHTNAAVEQSHVVLPSLDRYVTSVVQIVQQIMRADPKNHKIVVFFPTARLVGFFASFFNVGLGIEVIEIHSKKSQGFRNKASDKFRKAKRGVLFTSDVSARGVDYPDVTYVLQFGIPESRDQYIHRLGRTGRAGKAGKGLLVLAPFESKFVSELKGLDIPVNKEVSKMIENPVGEEVMNTIGPVFKLIRENDEVLTKSATLAYLAIIGYYRGNMKRTALRSSEELVAVANEYSKYMGLPEIPGIQKRLVSKMGLTGVHGLRITNKPDIRNGNVRGKGDRNRRNPLRRNS